MKVMLKSPIQQYKHCPICGEGLEFKGSNLLQCTSCFYNYYINSSPTASAILINDQKQILINQRAFEPKKDYWDTPGGFISLGETFEQALIRELNEELGVIIKLKYIYKTYYEEYDWHDVKLPLLNIVGICEIVEGKISPKDDIYNCKWINLNEIENYSFAFNSVKQSIIDFRTITHSTNSQI